MSNIKQSRALLAHKDCEGIGDDMEIGPIKVEPDSSTDYESNDEVEIPSKKPRMQGQLTKKMPSDKHIKIKHFSTKEEQTLWQLAQERKDILESKVSDAATWKRKELTWELLAQKFYDETGVCREWKKLRDKFLDMKRRKRKEALSMTKGYTPTDTLTKKELDIDASNGQPDVCEEDSLADVLSDHDTANIIGVQDDDMSSSSSKWTASNRSILRKETHVLPENANDDNCSLEKEKINLIRLQQDFYRSENLRAQERHNCEMRDKATQNCDESRERKLRIKLLELEVLEKRAKLKLKS